MIYISNTIRIISICPRPSLAKNTSRDKSLDLDIILRQLKKKKRYFCVVLRGYLNNPFTSAAMHIQPGTHPHAYDRIPWSRVPEFPGFRDCLVLRNPSLGDTDINERHYFAESAGAKK